MEIDLGQSARYEQSAAFLAPAEGKDGLEEENLEQCKHLGSVSSAWSVGTNSLTSTEKLYRDP